MTMFELPKRPPPPCWTFAKARMKPRRDSDIGTVSRSKDESSGKRGSVVVQVQPLDKCRYNDYYGFNEAAQAFRKNLVACGLP